MTTSFESIKAATTAVEAECAAEEQRLAQENRDLSAQLSSTYATIERLNAEIIALTADLEACRAGQTPTPGPVTYIAMRNDEAVVIAGLTARVQCDDTPMNSMFRRSDGRGFRMAVETGDDWNDTERSELIWPRFASGKFTLKGKIVITAPTLSPWCVVVQGHQSANTGNPPASLKMQASGKRWRVDRVSGASGITEVTLDRAYAVVPGTFDIVFAMITHATNGRIYCKLGTKVLADYTGPVGKAADSVDAKCGIYRGPTSTTDTVEFLDLVVTDGFSP